MEKEENVIKIKKSTLIKAVIAILLLIAVIGCGMFAYAKYRTTLTGTGSGAIANWSFKVNGSSSQIETINLADTLTESYSNVAEGKLAPGTSGSFSLTLDASDTEVAVHYSIAIENFVNKPTNLKFYEDAEHITEVVLTNDQITYTGNIALADVGTQITKTIYWDWPYQTGTTDEEELANDVIDNDVAGKTFTMQVTVIGTQIEPNESLIQTQILAQVVSVGDYVNYSASSGTEATYTTDESVTGSSTASTFNSSDTISGWRVLSVNSTAGTVTLMAADPTSSTLTLNGSTGYKNAETVLNAIGAVYGHGAGAISGRSINIADVEQYSSYDPYRYANSYSSTGYYGGTKTYTSGTFINEDGTEVTASESNPVTMTQTYYYYTAQSYYANTTAYNMLFKKSSDTSTNQSTYWLSSRSVNLNSDYCAFYVRYVNSGSVNIGHLYSSTSISNSNSYTVVPAVSLESNIQTTGKNASGVWQLVVE